MIGTTQINVDMIRRVAEQLGPLRERMVFLGGAVTGLLLTDPAAPEARFTEDVDMIAATGSYSQYSQLEESLRDLGFVNSHDVICRWTVAGIIVDIMPPDTQVFGFSNRWYHAAIETSVKYDLGTDLIVRLITAPYFLATKLEAFHDDNREGSGDYLISRDIADVIAVVDGRTELVSEIAECQGEVRSFLSETFQQMLTERDFLEALAGHLLPDEMSQQRLSILLQRLREIASER